MYRTALVSALVFLASFVVAGSAFSQNGIISGKAMGENPGDFLSGATMTLYQNNSPVSQVTTNEFGEYSFNGIYPGNYQVVGEYNGFYKTNNYAYVESSVMFYK